LSSKESCKIYKSK